MTPSSLGTTTAAAGSYSSEDPHAANGIRSISPSIYDGETESIFTEAAAFPARAQPSHSLPLKVNYEEGEEEEEEEGESPDWDDEDDARSDFYDAESVVSHVTRATLPEYEDALAMSALPPPVPAIPSRFLTPLQTGAAAAAVNNTLQGAISVTTTDPPPLFRTEVREEHEQDFHGFRPRQTTLASACLCALLRVIAEK